MSCSCRPGNAVAEEAGHQGKEGSSGRGCRLGTDGFSAFRIRESGGTDVGSLHFGSAGLTLPEHVIGVQAGGAGNMSEAAVLWVSPASSFMPFLKVARLLSVAFVQVDEAERKKREAYLKRQRELLLEMQKQKREEELEQYKMQHKLVPPRFIPLLPVDHRSTGAWGFSGYWLFWASPWNSETFLTTGRRFSAGSPARSSQQRGGDGG